MKLNFLSQLAGVALAAPVKETATKEDGQTTRTRVEKVPTNGADFRILANGKIYPSQAFVDEFGLEYQAKDSATISYGLDLFDSAQWGAYQQAAGTDGPRLLLGYVINQDKPKVELFAGTRYDKTTGEPINSVMEQGTVVADETLELIATALGFVETEAINETETNKTAFENLLNGRRYVDFQLIREAAGIPALTMPDGIYNIPKSIDRGERKGEMTTVRRERIVVIPIVEFEQEDQPEVTAEDTDGETLSAYHQADEEALRDSDEATTVDSEVEETADQMYHRLNQE